MTCNTDTLEALKDIIWHNLSWINQQTMCLPGDCSIFNKQASFYKHFRIRVGNIYWWKAKSVNSI